MATALGVTGPGYRRRVLQVTVADRAEPLAARLADVLRAAPVDPMAPEWIATPSAGMRAWLWLELARHLGSGGPDRHDGVAANLAPAFPGTLRSRVLAAGRDEDAADRWAVETLVWTVLAVLVDGHDADDPDDTDPLVVRFGRERLGYPQARRIADLFDRYHLHRPDMIRRWAAGDDVDSVGGQLPAHHRWQPHVWRQVRERVGEPSPPEALPHLLSEVRAGTLDLDLPQRLSFFGLPVLPGGRGFVDLAEAVAEHRDVHLFLLDPSPATSALVRADAARRDRPAVRRRADDAGPDLVEHPLLRSWGRLPRETALLLHDAESTGAFPPAEHLSAEPSGTVPSGPDPAAEAEEETLLARVQADLRAGRAPVGTAVADDSIRFHAAYGRRRQVDVARDAILHALAADPTLTEDDVLVVCPALDEFAPLITAGFGPSAGSTPPGPPPERSGTGRADTAGPPALRYRVADRSIGRDNTVVAGFDTLLELLPGRFDAVGLQDLIAQPAVRERYRFTDDDLARIADWVEVANVRWGLDAEHRVPFGVPATISANTWGVALDRLLLGSTLPDDDLAVTIGDLAPLGIEGDDVDLAGRLADLVHGLRELVDAIDDLRPLSEWLPLLKRAVEEMLAPPSDDAWQGEAVRRVLASIAEQAADVPGIDDVELGFADVRRLLRERLAAAPGRPPFFRGGITVTSPDSLRWVPHRMVVLLGMDQQAFSTPPGDGDDLAAALAFVGDREPRADRRLALLEAILATGERLVVIRDGRDLRTNQPVPPAVVVAELLDTVGSTVAGSSSPSDLEVHHARQAFDERNFLAEGGPGPDLPAPWSHDPAARRAAEARRHRAQEALPFVGEPLEDLDPDTFELAELIDAVSDPVASFVRRRLQLHLPEAEESASTQLPVDFGGLERWKVGDRMIEVIRRGVDVEDWLATERRRGSLPPGVLGDAGADDLRTTAAVLEEAVQRLDVAGDERGSVPVDLRLADGTRVVGSVITSLDGDAPGPARIGFGRMKPKYRLAAWIDLLALTATHPEKAWRSVVVNYKKPSGKQKGGARAGVAQVVDLSMRGGDADERRAGALEGLEAAVEVARRARREPLPIFPNLTHAVHEADKAGRRAKGNDWRDYNGWADGDKVHATLVFGDLDLDELYELASRSDDPFDEPNRLQGWARYVWDRYESSTVDAEAVRAAAAEEAET